MEGRTAGRRWHYSSQRQGVARRRCREGELLQLVEAATLTTQVIVTSALFPGGKFKEEVLKELCESVGKERLVVDIR